MTDIFDQLQQTIATLERALRTPGNDEGGIDDRILRDRTARVAREPARSETPEDTTTHLLFERTERRYAVPLSALEEVAPIGSIAAVPGIPEIFLGVTARKGRVFGVIDLPRLFSPGLVAQHAPKWLVICTSGECRCAIAVDEIHDLAEVSPGSIASSMPTFPALAQRYTVGVLEDRSVVLDVAGLLLDRSLHVEDRG